MLGKKNENAIKKELDVVAHISTKERERNKYTKRSLSRPFFIMLKSDRLCGKIMKELNKFESRT